ncbi:MAG: FecR domain-containing protein [Pseudomonadales bacterium]
MTTIQFPNLAEIERKSCDWVAAMDRGLSEREKSSLEDWLEESPLHAETLVKVAATWDLLDLLKPVAQLVPLDQSDAQLTVSRDEAELSAGEVSKSTNHMARISIAAGLFLCLLAILNWSEFTREVSPEVEFVEVAYSSHFSTAVGETSLVNLPDGSTVNLNTDSELSVNFRQGARTIVLKRGEAYFDVAKDEANPFSVAAGANKVTAVGTAFNVEISSDKEMEVVVTEGRVQLEHGYSNAMDAVSEKPIDGTPVFLSNGESIVVSESGERKGVIRTDNVEAKLAWREGQLIFEGEPLELVVEEINRYTMLSFEISDPAIREIPVGGFFKAGDTQQLLWVLEQSFGITSERNGQIISLSLRQN